MLLTIKNLNSIEKVRNFVNIINTLDGNFDLKSDRYTVDAKSIMGILSLDVSKELTLAFNSDFTKVKEALKDFIVE